MPNFVTDADGVGRLPRFSPEDLNVVTLDEQCRQLKRLMNAMKQQVNFRTKSWSKDRLEMLQQINAEKDFEKLKRLEKAND